MNLTSLFYGVGNQLNVDQISSSKVFQCSVSLHVLGHSTIYGDLKPHGLSSDGKPYVTASDGFHVNDVNQVCLFENLTRFMKKKAILKDIIQYQTFYVIRKVIHVNSFHI